MNSNAELHAIARLDLTSIKMKLTDKETGEGWSSAQVDAVEIEYRRFLCLMKLYPNEQVAPRFDVDIFWHYHILDTMKYAADCNQIFGGFLHHSPDSGSRGEDEQLAHQRNGARMQELYAATFGAAYVQAQDGYAATGAWCSPSTTKAAWCSPAAPTTAWCSPSTTQAAWCSPVAPKTAWCSPTISKNSWGSPVVAKTAWCSPLAPKTAWCSPGAPQPLAIAQNESSYSRAGLAEAA